MNKSLCRNFFLLVGVVSGILCVAGCRQLSRTSQAAPGAGKLSGHTQDEQRQPLAEVTIVIKETTASDPFPEIAPVSNAQGEFAFPALPPGSYVLLATRPGFQSQTQTATVSEGRPARVEFTLRREP